MMPDDLVTQLRHLVNELYGTHPCGLINEAADRIEQLELALRWIAAMTPDPEFGTPPTEVAVAVARNALEGKDG
jgi:HEPN domain-containing protein